jgi:hypothetical protein
MLTLYQKPVIVMRWLEIRRKAFDLVANFFNIKVNSGYFLHTLSPMFKKFLISRVKGRKRVQENLHV